MRQPTTLRRHVLILYFGLTFGFSWLLFIPAALLLGDRPGASPAEVPGVAPLQTAGAAVPSLVAIALASLLYGRQGLRQLFGGFRRWRVGIRWYLTAIFLAPLLTLVTGGSLVMALLYHASLNVAAGPLQFDPGDLVAPLMTWLVVSLLVLGYGARDLARRERFTWERGR